MVSYYNRVFGNLNPGDTAKCEDINHIQDNVGDAISSVIDDHHECQSFILGSNENDFILTPAPKTLGRYIDTYSLPVDDNLTPLSIREYNYRQPIPKTKSSLYSIILKMGNNTSYDVDVTCELQDINQVVLRQDTVTLKANSDKQEYEFIFDLRGYPTALEMDMEKLLKTEGRFIPPKPDEEAQDHGVDYRNIPDVHNFSVGVSQLYLVIKSLGIQNFDKDGNAYTEEFNETSFVVYADANGYYGANFNAFLEKSQGIAYETTPYSLYFKDIYATDVNYLCSGGQAIIGGEKVTCMDSHVTVSGASEYGNVLALVYMDSRGRLHSANSKASTSVSTNIDDWEMDDMLPLSYLLIAKILIYNDINKEPLVIQDDTNQETRPRSHHERLRRLEKEIDYTKDVAIPPRIKYTLTGSDWVETDGDIGLLSSIYKGASKDNDADKYPFYTTLDSKGNVVIKTTKNKVTTFDVTFKDDEVENNQSVILTSNQVSSTTPTVSKTSDTDLKSSDTETSLKSYASGDLKKLNRISEMQNIKIDTTKGIISLKVKTSSDSTSSSNSKTTSSTSTTNKSGSGLNTSLTGAVTSSNANSKSNLSEEQINAYVNQIKNNLGG